MAVTPRHRASADARSSAPASKASKAPSIASASKPGLAKSTAKPAVQPPARTAAKVGTKSLVKASIKVAPPVAPKAVPRPAAKPAAAPRRPTPGAAPFASPTASATDAAKAMASGLGLDAKPPESVQHLTEAVEAIGQGVGEVVKGIASLSVPPEALGQIQQDYLTQASQLWNQALEQPAAIELKDKRFASPAWKENAGSAFMASMYLLNANTLKRMADNLQGDQRSRDKVRFAVQQWVDAASPSNFLAFNPEAQKLALDTKGESLNTGLQHLVHDLKQGHMSQTDESLFELGRNVGMSEGSVVFENAFFQLIEYKPLTEKVRAKPFLFVPPCINKYYILDLQPENSLVRHVVASGQRAYMVSWVNADESLSKATWDDYIEHGVLKAIAVVQDIAGVDQINALGFCIGGTLLSCGLAVLAARGEKPVASLTLLTAFLDFVNTGPMDVFVDEPMVRMREMTMGEQSPQGGGLMNGGELATTFSFLRPNDLVWNYVVGNYLKGEAPPAFDLLYWNSDSTNLPGPMYCWYLRNTYLENKLKEPGAVNVCGVPLDLRRVDVPTFIYGSREDHIVPWDSAYASTQLVSGPKTFVLGASGHIAGVINPPEKKKRSFWQSPKGQVLPKVAGDWFKTAQEQPGSWWPTWLAWLDDHSGGWVKAPAKPGSRDFSVIEAAPGRYAKRRA